MSEENAREIVRIMLGADGGCPFCAASLLKEFAEKFPGFREIAKEMYGKEYPDWKTHFKYES